MSGPNFTTITSMITNLQTTLQDQAKQHTKDLEVRIMSHMVQLEETVASIWDPIHTTIPTSINDNRHVSFSDNTHEPDNVSQGFIQPPPPQSENFT